jgi:uncharacterized membrane protein
LETGRLRCFYQSVKIMRQVIFSDIGLIHLISSILALIFGTMVLVLTKGTRFHKQIGYAYAGSMLGVIVTAFMIYHLFGRFGIFHITAIISTISLLGGMIPVVLRKPVNGWLRLHYSFMFWSVIGLYAAFAAETLVRIPQVPFFGMVGFASFGVTIIGGIFFAIYKKKWANFY